MKSRLNICGLAALLVAIFGVANGENNPFIDDIERTKEKVYRVETREGAFLGTAFAVNKYGQFVTCAHVLMKDTTCLDTVFLLNYVSILSPHVIGPGKIDTLEAYEKMRFAAFTAHIFPKHDLAILQIDLRKYDIEHQPFFGIANAENLREGQDIAICAFIDDCFTTPKPFIAKGIVSTIRSNVYNPKLDNKIGIIQMDLSVSKGTSGGPIFYPNSKRVVAIQNAGIFESQKSSQTNYAIAVMADQILPYLDSLDIPYDYRE